MKPCKQTVVFLIFLPLVLLQRPVSVVKFIQLQAAASTKQNDTLYVVNFWATWCAPCVKELPCFQKAYTKFSNQKVKMVFVSLNSPKELATVQKFATDKNLQPEVLLLNESNPNTWIDKVDSTWSGSIPATVLYKHGEKLYFHEGELTEEELTKLILTKNN